MPEKKESFDQDEINIVDIFIVMLKRRKLIIWTTLLAVILSVTGYFLYPSYQLNKAQEAQKLEAHLRVVPWPGLKTLELNYNLEQLFNRAPSILYALREAGYTEFGYDGGYTIDLTDTTKTSQALFVVQQRVEKNQTLDGDSLDPKRRLYYTNITSEGVEVVFKNDDEERAKRFLMAMFKITNEELTALLLTQAESIVSAYERLLAIEAPSDSVQTSIAAGQQRYDTAKRMLAGQADAINQLGDIYVVEPGITLGSFKSDYMKKAVIIVFAALFLSIFLAFILNAVSNIKSDEESMRKIREAWKSTRK